MSKYMSRKQYPDSGDKGTGTGWDQWHEIVEQPDSKVVLAAVLSAEVIDVTEALNRAYEAGREDERAAVSYELQHKKRDERHWRFARHIEGGPAAARLELRRVRALAEGSETGVLYRIVRRTERIMGW